MEFRVWINKKKTKNCVSQGLACVNIIQILYQENQSLSRDLQSLSEAKQRRARNENICKPIIDKPSVKSIAVINIYTWGILPNLGILKIYYDSMHVT